MPVIETHRLQHGGEIPYQHQTYNALDCCLTFEIWEELQSLFNEPPAIYGFERALQGPALDIMSRGFLIDQYERQKGIKLLEERIARLDYLLQTMAKSVWDKPINPRSHLQLKEFFYKFMNIPEIWSSLKGVRALRMNRETLEKIDLYFHARPIVACIMEIRELGKMMDVLKADIDPDGRMRTSINVGATETGRFSSSTSTTGTGTNLFNVSDELRRMFISDPGWKLCAIDREQAESREVGFLLGILFDDWSYLNACENGDLHSTTARMVWPDLKWPEDPKGWRAIADQNFYRHYSYRDMSKRGGHGTTYYGTPPTMARHLKVPVPMMVSFQNKFFQAYPGIQKWHQWVASEIQTTQQLTTIFGRNRHFYGRPGDDTTLREAIAYSPQSATADRTNIGMWRVWSEFGNRIQLLLNLYDAIYFQYREDDNEKEVLEEALRLTSVPLEQKGRRFDVPGEIKIGWNWQSFDPKTNPDGLMKWKGKDERKRLTLLERPL